MQRLFFTLTLLINITSLHGMEVPNKQNRSALPEMYRYLPEKYCQLYKTALLPEIIHHIFSLQFAIDKKKAIGRPLHGLARKESADQLMSGVSLSLIQYGYLIAVEQLKHNLATQKISLCNANLRTEHGHTVLHVLTGSINRYNDINLARIFLEAAGSDVLSLLTVQEKFFKNTALHDAVAENHTELIKLFLDAAGDHASALINIPNKEGKTAYNYYATPEAKEIMRQYLQKK